MNNFAPPKRLQGIEKSVIRQVFDRAQPGSINLGLGEPDLWTPAIIRETAVAAITQGQNGYTSHAGLPALRHLIAAEYAYLEGNIDRVIVTAGSQEALYLALMVLVDEGDEVAVDSNQVAAGSDTSDGGRGLDNGIRCLQFVAGAKKSAELQRFSEPHLATPSTTAEHRLDRIRRSTFVKIDRHQHVLAVKHRPPAGTRVPQAPKQLVERQPTGRPQDRLVRARGQIGVHVPRPTGAERRHS